MGWRMCHGGHWWREADSEDRDLPNTPPSRNTAYLLCLLSRRSDLICAPLSLSLFVMPAGPNSSGHVTALLGDRGPWLRTALQACLIKDMPWCTGSLSNRLRRLLRLFSHLDGSFDWTSNWTFEFPVDLKNRMEVIVNFERRACVFFKWTPVLCKDSDGHGSRCLVAWSSWDCKPTSLSVFGKGSESKRIEWRQAQRLLKWPFNQPGPQEDNLMTITWWNNLMTRTPTPRYPHKSNLPTPAATSVPWLVWITRHMQDRDPPLTTYWQEWKRWHDGVTWWFNHSCSASLWLTDARKNFA